MRYDDISVSSPTEPAFLFLDKVGFLVLIFGFVHGFVHFSDVDLFSLPDLQLAAAQAVPRLSPDPPQPANPAAEDGG